MGSPPEVCGNKTRAPVKRSAKKLKPDRTFHRSGMVREFAGRLSIGEDATAFHHSVKQDFFPMIRLTVPVFCIAIRVRPKMEHSVYERI